MAAHLEGAFTGEISGAMLKAFGCRYVLLGHSECRQHHGETDEQIARKLIIAHKIGLIPIVCLGETLAQHQSGQTEAVLAIQLNPYLTLDQTVLQNLVLAYEPIWAINTGQSATFEQAQSIHHALRARLFEHLGARLAYQIRILYGGSVTPDNAKALFAMPDIDGGLIGKSALSADAFLQIYHAFS